MNNDDFLLLVSKKLSGEATGAEVLQLDQILLEDAECNAQYKMLQQFWDEHDRPNQLIVEDGLQKVLSRLNLSTSETLTDELPVGKRRFMFSRRLSVAAGVALLLSLGIFTAMMLNNREKKSNQAVLEKKHNSKGIKSTIELADGSKVWLNADSRIEYPELFTGNTREIYLNGEAFFEVAKNPEKPFIIHLANGTVRVLGTSFNVRAYDNEKIVETSVATGKVAFIPKYKMRAKIQDTIFITPNNKARYLFNAEKITVQPTLAQDDKAWTEGKLLFKSMTLQDIAVELERNFGKRVHFIDEEAKDYVLTGSFQNNTLEDIMFYLSLSKTKKFYYKITNTELLIATRADKI